MDLGRDSEYLLLEGELPSVLVASMDQRFMLLVHLLPIIIALERVVG